MSDLWPSLRFSFYWKINADHTIDGELSAAGFSRSTDWERFFTNLGEHLPSLVGFWIQVVVLLDSDKYDPELHKTDFERYRGQLAYRRHWVRMHRLVEALLGAQLMVQNMEDRKHRATGVRVLFHWNDSNERPSR